MAFHTPSHRIERVGSGRMGSGVRRLLSFPFTVMMRCIVTKIVQSMYGVGVSGGRGLIQCDPSFSDVSTFVGAERVRNVPSTLSRFSTFGFLALTAHHGSPTRESPPRPATLLSRPCLTLRSHPLYQLAFFTPGRLPASACNRKLYCGQTCQPTAVHRRLFPPLPRRPPTHRGRNMEWQANAPSTS